MSNRALVWAGSLLAGFLFIVLLSLVLRAGTESLWPPFLLDRDSPFFPFTVQNAIWMVFFVAGGELVLVRLKSGRMEEEQLWKRLLPEDAETVLRQKDLAPYYRRVRDTDRGGHFWLQRLLSTTLLQFQSSGSIDQVNAVFNSSMELYQHEIDLRYNLLRYMVWLIPTLGFIGTVMGIAFSLETAGAAFADLDPNANMAELGPEMMKELTGSLGVAFYTTLLALLLSAVLMATLHLVQGREETALNRVGQYCLKNLVNRLYEERS